MVRVPVKGPSPRVFRGLGLKGLRFRFWARVYGFCKAPVKDPMDIQTIYRRVLTTGGLMGLGGSGFY